MEWVRRWKMYQNRVTASWTCTQIYKTTRWNNHWTLFVSLSFFFYSKQTATGARQCLSTGHRKLQDFLLWTLPLWTLVALIRSSVSISGPCASCKAGRVKRRLLNWQLTRSAILYIRVRVLCPTAKYLLSLQPKSKTSKIYNLNGFQTTSGKNQNRSLEYVWLSASRVEKSRFHTNRPNYTKALFRTAVFKPRRVRNKPKSHR